MYRHNGRAVYESLHCEEADIPGFHIKFMRDNFFKSRIGNGAAGKQEAEFFAFLFNFQGAVG